MTQIFLQIYQFEGNLCPILTKFVINGALFKKIGKVLPMQILKIPY